jgi:hypothetical protein
MQGPLVLPARSETVVSEASLIEDIEVIEVSSVCSRFPPSSTRAK